MKTVKAREYNDEPVTEDVRERAVVEGRKRPSMTRRPINSWHGKSVGITKPRLLSRAGWPPDGGNGLCRPLSRSMALILSETMKSGKMSSKLVRTWIGIPIIFFSTALCAAEAPPDALLLADNQWNELRVSGDVQALSQLLSERWVLTHSDGKVQFKRDYLDQLTTGDRRNTRITNQHTSYVLYGTTAVVTGQSSQSGIGSQGPFSGTFRFTRTWVLQDGKWMMVASHSSRLAPQDAG